MDKRTAIGAVLGLVGLPYGRRSVYPTAKRQPHWRKAQSAEARSEALAAAERKRARKARKLSASTMAGH